MKALQELYTEIMGSDELRKGYLEAAKNGKIAEFIKANGCEATEEEIKEFLKGKAGQQLSDDELESVAGGTCNSRTEEEAYNSACTLGIACAAIAISSLKHGHVGQKKDTEGRLCTNPKNSH